MEHTVDARAIEDLAGFASWARSIALDLGTVRGCTSVVDGGYNLSLSTTFAIHSLTRFVRGPAGRQAVDANLRARHCGGHALGDLGRGGRRHRHGSG